MAYLQMQRKPPRSGRRVRRAPRAAPVVILVWVRIAACVMPHALPDFLSERRGGCQRREQLTCTGVACTLVIVDNLTWRFQATCIHVKRLLNSPDLAPRGLAWGL